MRLCDTCGEKIPAKRLAGKDPESTTTRFCTDRCQLAYAEAIIRTYSAAENQVKEQLSSEHGPGWFTIFQEELEESLNNEKGLEGASARFFGGVAGRITPILAQRLWDRVREHYASKKKEREEAEDRPKPEGRPKPEASNPPPRTTPPPKNSPPPPKPTPPPKESKRKKYDDGKEPENLDDLPLKTQRKWLVRRFKKLSPDAKPEEIKKEHLRLLKAHHPDTAGADQQKAAALHRYVAILNATVQRIREIDEHFGNPWK